MILFRKLLKEEIFKIIVFTILMAVISIAQVLLWPTFTKMIPALKDMVPSTFSWIVDGFLDDGFIYFLITQQFMKNIGMFGGFMAILLGASAISKELETGTMVHLLAQPISRTRVIMEKYVFNALALSFPVILSSVLIAPVTPIINEHINPLYLIYSGFFCYLIVLNIFSFVFLVGIFVDEQMKVISIGLSFTIVMMILSIFKETSFFSIFGWMDPEILKPLIKHGLFPVKEALQSFGLSTFCLIAAVRFFKKTNI